MTDVDLRQHVAWLIWCYDQGYRKPEDRAILTNWTGRDPSTLTPKDTAEQAALLAMADDIILTIVNEHEGTRNDRTLPRETPQRLHADRTGNQASRSTRTRRINCPQGDPTCRGCGTDCRPY